MERLGREGDVSPSISCRGNAWVELPLYSSLWFYGAHKDNCAICFTTLYSLEFHYEGIWRLRIKSLLIQLTLIINSILSSQIMLWSKICYGRNIASKFLFYTPTPSFVRRGLVISKIKCSDLRTRPIPFAQSSCICIKNVTAKIT
jgi:hypothetical protein